MEVHLHNFCAAILILGFLFTPQTLAAVPSADSIFSSVTTDTKILTELLVILQTLHRAVLKVENKAATEVPLTTPFPCDLQNIKIKSDTVPNSAHEVRPGDIDVVGAVGDSLTAGTGISAIITLEELVISERGRAWSAGGEGTWRNFLTVPNILKEFNPDLYGFALSSERTEKASKFNVAINGAKSNSVPKMVEDIVSKMKADSNVDINNHWKMVTLMIGDNDFCSVCKLANPYDALEAHRADLLEGLRYLRDNLPRTIVNLVPAPRLDDFYYNMEDLTIWCKNIQMSVCPCVRDPEYESVWNITSDVMEKWQQVDVEVSNLAEFDLDNFTVILQSYTLDYKIPRTAEGVVDYGYFAPDCFHFSERGTARFANNLWNGLFEPVGTSTDGTDVFTKFNCPTQEHPYIFTRRNSA